MLLAVALALGPGVAGDEGADAARAEPGAQPLPHPRTRGRGGRAGRDEGGAGRAVVLPARERRRLRRRDRRLARSGSKPGSAATSWASSCRRSSPSGSTGTPPSPATRSRREAACRSSSSPRPAASSPCTPDRKAFLADGFPFLVAIDGRPIAEWRAAAAVLVPKGSPQYVLHGSLRRLRELDYWRTKMGLPKKDAVEAELAGPDGARKTVSLPVAKTLAPPGVWPSGGSRPLPGNVGYLRLATMETSTSLPEIKRWMPAFRDTAGLIVDVRDNNGGDRDPLLLLYSYLAAADDPPRVFTAAAVRLHAAHKDDHLAENHRMYRADAEEWSARERQAVADFASTFSPAWQPPAGQFSDWHYMALTRNGRSGRLPLRLSL